MRIGDREDWRRADAIFTELLDLPTGERERRLAASGLAEPVRRHVEELFAADSSTSVLDRQLTLAAAVAPAPEPPRLTGRQLGAYVLDEEIGRGGMAVVYAAHRVDGAFDQEVAIKVLGTGLLPTSAEARFRREQELLARLRHPHVATLLDGGVAEDGTPFLVMERIDGRALDRFADEERLDAGRRVDLLLQVANAVAFAHRNLVVHRDLKPGNVLVTAGGEAKLLDFGIAKLLEPDGEAGERTQARSRLLTPGYAAPEQLDGRPVTTATDVFGLGKILERLLRDVAVDRDLSNIRGRALHPEPERRYADARAFAEDLARWRAGRPVQASPDSWAYRARKWALRHRAALAAAVLVVGVGVAGLAVSLAQARRATREAKSAAAVTAFLTGLLEAHDPDRAGGDDPPASELFRRGAAKVRAELSGEPELQAQMLHTIGRIQVERGLYDDARFSLDEALRLRLALDGERGIGAARIRDTLGALLIHDGDFEAAIAAKRQSLAAFDRERPAGDPERLDVAVGLAEVLAVNENLEEARDLSLAILADGAASRGAGAVLAAANQTLGMALQGLGDAEGAAAALERAASPGPTTDLGIFLNDYGLILLDLGRYEPAEAAFLEALAIKRRILGDRHVQVAVTLTNLGYARNYLGRFDEGVANHLEALAVSRALFAPPHPELVEAIGGTATALRQSGRTAEALPLFEEALALSRSVAPDLRAANYTSHVAQYGALLLELGRPAEAEAELREAIAGYASREGQGGHRIHVARARRAAALVALRRWDEAARDFATSLPALAESPLGWGKPEYAAWHLLAAEATLEAGRPGDAGRTLDALRRRFAEHPDERTPELATRLESLDTRLPPAR